MKKISFQEKNNLIVKHKNGEYFSKDLELFKKHCPGHPLNNDLAKANKFNFARLDGLMISFLLDFIGIEDILKNRLSVNEDLPEQKTEDEIRSLLVDQFELDEADLEALSGIIPLWVEKTDDEIVSAVKKLLGDKSVDDNIDGDDIVEEIEVTPLETETSDVTTASQTIERDNVKKFTKRIGEAKTIEEVEAILKEDLEGGERLTVQNAGQKRIDILKASITESDSKKKDQSTTNSQK